MAFRVDADAIKGACERKFGDLSRASIKIGVWDEGQTEGTPVPEYAAYNEFGTKKIPPRPFMRMTWAIYAAYVQRLARGLLEAGKGIEGAAHGIGQQGASEMRAMIESSVPPPNALETLVRKAPETRTLIHTGTMLESVSYRVNDEPGGGEQ